MYTQAPLDFALVSTYVPLLVTIARALALTCAVHLPTMLPANVVSAAMLFWVYLDAQAHLAVHASQIASHLMPVAFFLLTRTKDAAGTSYDAWIAVDATWACVCVALWAAHVFRWRLRSAWAATFATSSMTLLHLYYGLDASSLTEVCVRIVAFYILCFVHYHAFVCRVSCDAAAHACAGPHVCLYVLFLQRYVLLCALTVTVALVCRLWVGDKRYGAWSEHRYDAHKPQARAYDTERGEACKPQARAVVPHAHETAAEGGMDDLLVELRLAQASRV
jgi:hypothetical protein